MNRAVLWILVFTVIFLWGAYMLVPAYTEHQKTQHELQEVKKRTLDQQMANQDLRTDIHRLKSDPRTIERVAREKFGYVRPGETIYDFSSSSPKESEEH